MDRATAKAIAARAGCSEAALYKHFPDKGHIFVSVLQERMPELGPLLIHLNTQGAHAGVRETLYEVIEAALAFYVAVFPLAIGVFSERRLLEDHRTSVLAASAGPRQPNLALSTYLRAEQDRGRLVAPSDPDAVANLLLGACLQQAFFRHFYGETAPFDPGPPARAIVDVVMDGIQADG